MLISLIKELKKERYITLEVTPSHGGSIDNILENIKAYELIKNISGFSVTDSPLARLKYSSLFAAIKLQNTFKKPAIATMSMRDRNKIALQSDLLGASDNGICNILALTGDPASASDQPLVKGVFESNSTLLLDIIGCLNSTMDFSGKPLKYPLTNQITPFCVCNAHAKNPKTLIKKMAQKISHGAVGIITQPVYSKENAIMLLDFFEEAKILAKEKTNETNLILGYFPITKLRTAQFLSSHVPGVSVPKKWIEILKDAHEIGNEQEYEKGLELSKQTFLEIINLHPKIHLMSANNFDLASKILRSI